MKLDIVIIGAGAAGIGLASYLKAQQINQFVVLEKGEIGQNFINWPAETRLITPSFTSNGFGIPDLNAVTPTTSPAFTLGKERLSGREFADYLSCVAHSYELPILCHTEVYHLEKVDDWYYLQTNNGCIQARYVILALGEFDQPSLSQIKGGELGLHYGQITSFGGLVGSDFCIIGGNESGMDAALNLASKGGAVDLFTEHSGLSAPEADPSIRLSPYTRQRYQQALDRGAKISIHENYLLKEIKQKGDQFQLIFDNEQEFLCSNPPILATGFDSAVFKLAPQFFNKNADGLPEVNMYDESTIASNIFLAGPSLRQPGAIFCYIYKFRQRFAPLIGEIARRESWTLDPNIEALYRQNMMYLDDLTCCQVACDC
ncbi:NAD(P)/FAD-dependent oxidoreductase [Vaginisenegalia massiliensis]|uniref:NAD(P)/FAD-dependent oxidoreductase n=1 Tax=Vaginisenegalia massiliensis TaxID=2058294 RepID=UPI000F522CB5|nr:NAD(P)/FAD-dependent oxidoreductase [Vaginisenegalia massiliensis]